MNIRTVVLTLVASVAFLLSGCSSTGLTAFSHVTNIQLSHANYRIVATNISGEGSTEAVVGVSIGAGFGTSHVAFNSAQ